MINMTPDHRSELQENIRRSMLETLQVLSDRDQQARYKLNVPYVHIPIEILAQWDQFSDLLKEERDWFIESLTEQELIAIRRFDTVIAAFSYEGSLPDVPDVFDVPEWLALMNQARLSLKAMRNSDLVADGNA